jgi:hypothetical protein
MEIETSVIKKSHQKLQAMCFWIAKSPHLIPESSFFPQGWSRFRRTVNSRAVQELE